MIERYLTKFYSSAPRILTQSAKSDGSESMPSGYDIAGCASVFDEVDTVGDVVRKGAFSGQTSENVAMFFNHQHLSCPPGKWTEMSENDTHLHVRGILTKGVSVAEDVRASIAANTVSGLSICGIASGLENKTGGLDIEKFELFEISIVTFPACLSARISKQNLSKFRNEHNILTALNALTKELN